MSSGEGRISMAPLNSSFSHLVDLYDNLQESSDMREVRKGVKRSLRHMKGRTVLGFVDLWFPQVIHTPLKDRSRI
jgi:hypothetical protein